MTNVNCIKYKNYIMKHLSNTNKVRLPFSSVFNFFVMLADIKEKLRVFHNYSLKYITRSKSYPGLNSLESCIVNI